MELTPQVCNLPLVHAESLIKPVSQVYLGQAEGL